MNPSHSSSPSAPAGDFGAGGGGTPAGGALAETKEKLTQAARDATAKVKDTAARAKDDAGRLATEKKETAAGRIGDYGSALHDSARSIEAKDPNIAWFTHRTADRLQGVADYLRRSDFTSLRRDAEGFARRHPAAFFGGMFVAGLVVGNLLKASRRRYDGDRRHFDDEERFSDTERAEGFRQLSENAPDLTAAERRAAGI